jgi:UDPglucose--hexose-1-phosphate uridylyltransferase
MSERPSYHVDPATGRPILVAPHRRNRPMHTDPDQALGPCPFCPGEEHQTPPERDAIRAPGTAPPGPGWRVRAFGNLYPAAEWHEVIAEGAPHETQPGNLDAHLWQDALALWRRRIAHMEAQPGVACAFLFKNVGRAAGASVAHNHSQMLGLPTLPPRLALELAQCQALGCVPCAELADAAREGRVVFAGDHHTVLCPRTPKLPFETWLVPHDHGARFDDSTRDRDLARVLRAAFAAVDRAFASPPFNSWLHRVPRADFHWHFEFQPRTGFVAGLELGGDMYINSVRPADAAARLRGEGG